MNQSEVSESEVVSRVEQIVRDRLGAKFDD